MDSLHRALNRGIQRYLYDPEPTNTHPDEPIACLGQLYTCTPALPSSSNESGRTERPQASAWPRGFLSDMEARLWFTYRTGFAKIPRDIGQTRQVEQGTRLFARKRSATSISDAGFTSDTGFGCMIRSAQTLLANALMMVHLSRSWRHGDDAEAESRLLRLFADDPRAPFSIHRFMAHGAAACDKPAGQWFGPQAASQCIKALNQGYSASGIAVYLADEQGGTIYADEVLKLAYAPAPVADQDGDFDLVPDPDPPFTPVLILIPSRLGHDQINARYHSTLLDLFALDFFAGIAGGRPASAHYFFAKQGDALFFLDPHFPRPALPFLEDERKAYSAEELASAHTRRVRRMALTEVDPSMLIGFLIRDLAGWQRFRRYLEEATLKGKLTRALQVCCILESRSRRSPSSAEARSPRSPLPQLRRKSTSTGQRRASHSNGQGHASLQQFPSLDSNTSSDLFDSPTLGGRNGTPSTSMDSGEMIGLPGEQDEDNFGVLSDEEAPLETSDEDAVDLANSGAEHDDLLSEEEGLQ